MSAKERCVRGHWTGSPGTRYRNGNCKQCVRVRAPGMHRRGSLFEPLSVPASYLLGDYFLVEAEQHLLDYPNQPRVFGWPASGYGWPEDEYTIILLARLLGARPNHWKVVA